ncbi:hypothetical protein NDU88_002683 [Pleurodeles waltl]|uniref:Uncharacterized protein n=1 Tax=Pleurodeles waltl TaxID=8319 RepID=A0AAV7TNT7_PLEWA|nr:hypothetical protein NDU88_002683 [Pleurodeles waltl]
MCRAAEAPLLRVLRQALGHEATAVILEAKLHAMLTSPPACTHGSRNGSLELSLGLRELLEASGVQYCRGREPELRLLSTNLYKLVHCLLVHGPRAEGDFEHLPQVPPEGTEGPAKASHSPAAEEAMGTEGEQPLVENGEAPGSTSRGWPRMRPETLCSRSRTGRCAVQARVLVPRRGALLVP